MSLDKEETLFRVKGIQEALKYFGFACLVLCGISIIGLALSFLFSSFFWNTPTVKGALLILVCVFFVGMVLSTYFHVNLESKIKILESGIKG